MANRNHEAKVKMAFAWCMYLKKRRHAVRTMYKDNVLPRIPFHKINKRLSVAFFETVLAYLHRPRERILWMHPRSLIWFDMVDQTYNDELWYANFRVTRETFVFILHEVEEDICRKHTYMRDPISAKRRLALTLYYLASTAEYRTVANLFGVSRSLTCQCVKEVCCAIVKRFPRMISFPKGDDLVEVLESYEQKWGFPMCAGAIDGTHIPILAPVESHVEYVNRKGFHSIIMQAITDCNYLFRDVVIGWPGSVHDARVLSNSAIFKNGNEKHLFPAGLVKEIGGVEIAPFLVGDPAYPLLPWLLKGYPRNNASEMEKRFNYNLSRARMTIENTFGRWKGRFVRFGKRVDMEVSSLVNVVHASCILHNMCELQKNNFLPYWEVVGAIEELNEPEDEIEAAQDADNIRSVLTEHFA